MLTANLILIIKRTNRITLIDKVVNIFSLNVWKISTRFQEYILYFYSECRNGKSRQKRKSNFFCVFICEAGHWSNPQYLSIFICNRCNITSMHQFAENPSSFTESVSKEEDNSIHIQYEFPWGRDSVEIIRNHGSHFLESCNPDLKEQISSNPHQKVLTQRVMFTQTKSSISKYNKYSMWIDQVLRFLHQK